jgi:hypothetical protein
VRVVAAGGYMTGVKARPVKNSWDCADLFGLIVPE